MAVPIVAGGALLGERMLYFFYGAGFAWGYTTLVILFCAQLINVFQTFFTMCLGALDRQRDAFHVTAISSGANIIFNLILIPVIGIEGAAIATVVTMALNALLAKRVLSTIIQVKLDTRSILNIFKATAAMSVFVGVYIYLIPVTSVWLTLLPIAVGGMIYGLLILKLDPAIYSDLKDISTRMNLPWPKLL